MSLETETANVHTDALNIRNNYCSNPPDNSEDATYRQTLNVA